MTKKHQFILLLIVCSAAITLSAFSCKDIYLLKNRSKDTLYIAAFEKDSLDNIFYWANDSLHRPVIRESDTTVIHINNKEIVLDNDYCVLPDSTTLFIDVHFFNVYDTCYLYAVKRNILMRYSLDEIRKRKLYDLQIVTKEDFKDRHFDYYPSGKR